MTMALDALMRTHTGPRHKVFSSIYFGVETDSSVFPQTFSSADCRAVRQCIEDLHLFDSTLIMPPAPSQCPSHITPLTPVPVP